MASSEILPRPHRIEWKTAALYALLGMCAVTIAILGWRVWLLYFVPAVPMDSPITESIPVARPVFLPTTTTSTSSGLEGRYPVLYPPADLPETRPAKSIRKHRPDAAIPKDDVLKPNLQDGDRVLKPEL